MKLLLTLYFTAAAFRCSAATSFEVAVQPFVAKNCYGCHNEKLSAGSLNLRAFPTTESFLAGRETWERVLARLSAGEMPPPNAHRPPEAEISAVTGWLNEEFERQDRAKPQNPGRVTARRLNRYEYNATIRDLLAVDSHPADDFPADDFGYGFDNIGDILSLSPALMEKYLTAARRIAQLAIEPAPVPKKPGVEHRSNLAELYPYVWKRKFTWEADYVLRFAFPYFVDSRHDPGTVYISIDGSDPQAFPMATEYGNEGRFQDIRLHLTAGPHQLKAWGVRDDDATIADEWKKEQARVERAKRLREAAIPDSAPNSAKAGPNSPEARAKLLAPPVPKEDIERKVRAARQPYVEYVEVQGPYNPKPAPLPEGYKRVFICGHAPGHHTPSCLRTDIADLARRAWRRDVNPSETAKLVSFLRMAQQQGDTQEQSMRVGIMAVLVAPDFLFRIERAPANDVGKISDFEFASRLSYFLWSSMPDEELFQLARRNQLSNGATVEREVRRMLNDPKSEALVDNFGGQWLETRNLNSVKPDPDKFPQFTEAVRDAMKEETRLFISNLIREDRSILDFIAAKYTFANETLGKLYGLPGIQGQEFRKVDLTGTPRIGVLTQGSVLTVSSYATRTSPVLRGKWILENFLNAPPPPPPPNVPSLDASAVGSSATLREQMEKHRANPACSSCHAKMDPLGFGLENFDAIGRWRTSDGAFPIDSKGKLPNGATFGTPEELALVLAQDKDVFARCVTEKLLTFALGRGLESYDRPAVAQIVRDSAANNYRFSDLILGITRSAPFQMRSRVHATKPDVTTLEVKKSEVKP